MNFLYAILIIAASSFLWRVRGGLEFNGKKAPENKIWYALFVSLLGQFYFGWSFVQYLLCFGVTFASYQLYGWGSYIGRLLDYSYKDRLDDPITEEECELIDDILVKLKLQDKPFLWGLVGTSLTGLIVTFLIGSYFHNIWLILSGLGMGVIYLCGKLLCKAFGWKNPWGLGEWLFGAYLGIVFSFILLT